MAFGYSLYTELMKKLNGSLYEDFQAEVNDDTNEYNIITKNGGYLTFIDILGSLSVMDDNTAIEFIDRIMDKIQGDLSEAGRVIDFCIMYDPNKGDIPTQQNMRLLDTSIKSLKMNPGKFFSEKSGILTKASGYYSCYMAIYTDPSVLGGGEGEAKKRLNGDILSGKKLPALGKNTPNVSAGISEVGDSHNAFVRNLMKALVGKLNFQPMKAHQGMAMMRKNLFLDHTHEKWKPSFPGEKIRLNSKSKSPVKTDMSDFLSPSLATQFYSITPVRDVDNTSIVDIDGLKVAPLSAELGPERAKSFAELADNLKGNIPYRINISFFTGHEATKRRLTNKHSFGAYVAIFNSNNKAIRSSIKEMLELAEQEVMCDVSITACTWGKTLDECVRNKTGLMQAMQNWGGIGIAEERSDPIGIMAESVGGLLKPASRQAAKFPIPISDALFMSPISIPSSPWKAGPMMFMTNYGSLYPSEVGSPLQTSWLNLIFAPPGYGKSFLVAALNLSYLLKPGVKSLPVLSILDIGYSSQVFVRLVKAMLPEKDKHLVQAYKLQNTKEYAINIFDTMLGCRFPTSLERSQIQDIVMELVTPSEGGRFDGMEDIVKLMVEKVYAFRSDYGEPKEFNSGQEPEVTEALNSAGIEIYPDMTWWSVVDALHRAGEHRLAKRAQRHAVPRLTDLAAVLSDNAFDDYRNYSINGMEAISKIKQAINSAARDYGLLSTITQFDISDARVIALDLQDVVPKSDGTSNKQANIMYMIGKLATTKSFYMGAEALKEVNQEYLAYHEKAFEELNGVPKHLAVDEYHRASSSNIFRSGLIRDVREGRKFGIVISVISQFDTDFDEALIKAATSNYILFVGDDREEQNRIQKRFSINNGAMKQAIAMCNGPDENGSNLLYVSRIKGRGVIQQVLSYKGGIQEQWGYTTDKNDNRLLEKLISRVGLEQALEIMAEEFPKGSAGAYLTALAQSDEAKNLQVDIVTYTADKLIRDNYRG